nr:Tn3 family transposase [Herpetosiphonaceae bacterium]
YVDSHGQSEVAFGLCRLLGFDLLPRLKPIHTQKLYLPSAAHAARYPRLALVLTRVIDWSLIRQQYDDLIKYATALRSGIAEAEAILSRFTRQTSHATYRAMAELGRVMKTIFLCRYVHDLNLRREIHEGLNVVENWNSANSFICYGRQGEFATNKREHMEMAMLALHLLQNCLVYINTLMFQEILADPAWMARMTKADLRALTPLIYHHINPYGTFTLDLTTRLPFRDLLAA